MLPVQGSFHIGAVRTGTYGLGLRSVARTTRWIAVLGMTLAVVLGVPAAALAGTYSWSIPGNFTATPPGSNPDHDTYGGTPWSYTVYHGATQASLQFSTAVNGGLSGWSDGANGFLAKNTTGSAIGGVPSNGFAMQSPQTGSVALQWLSPLAGNVSVAGSVVQANPGPASCRYVWALSSDSTIVANGDSVTAGAISTNVAVRQATRLLLYVQDASASGHYNPSCQTALVSLTVSTPATPPGVTLTSPSAGSTVAGQPTFSGGASTAFGASGTVTVRVYGGSQVTGSPVETLTPGVSGGRYSAATTTPLISGTYTAQAEQDDLAGDRGLSPPVTFTVKNIPPTVTLNRVGSALVTSTPTLTGTAGTSSEDQAQVYLGLYAGPAASGKLVRLVAGSRASNGAFSIRVAPGLPDGIYTAVAGQGGYGGNGFSAPVTIEIKVHPPAVTVDRPEDGAAINAGGVVFSGDAGNAAGDHPQVKLALYSGPLVVGKPQATVMIRAKGSGWFYKWPRKLAVGFYSVIVQQSDNAGHTVTKQSTFLVTVLPQVVGYVLSLDKHGYVGIRVTCPAEGGFCVGDVLAVTSKALQPVRGGPTGRLRLLFIRVRIRAGQTSFVRRRLGRPVVNELRQNTPMEVRVGAILTPTDGRVIRVFRFRVLSVG